MKRELDIKDWEDQCRPKYAHYKLDGHYTRIEVSKNGLPHAYTSLGTDITEAFLQSVCGHGNLPMSLPPKLVLHGELIDPTKHASYVKTALAQKKPLWLYGIAVEGVSLGSNVPLQKLEEYLVSIRVPHIPHVDITDYPASIGAFLQEPLPTICGRTIEGWVLKDCHLGTMYRWKPVRTIDLVIKAFTPAKAGKYSGQIGAIVCHTAEGHNVANVSGMTDLVRSRMTRNPNDYIGKVVEITYQEVAAKGKLRFPRYIRQRDDKLPSQCTLDQDPTLKEFWNE